MEKKNINKLLSIIFVTGAIVLSLELLASRILLPFFGSSIYIWTSILSVTLIFLAFGYQLGGWITSKVNSNYYEELFIFIPFVSAIFILISTLTYPILLPYLLNFNMLAGCFIGSSLLLAIPLILMSSLNPILISIIKSKNDQSSDSKSGFILSISTFGSVFGVIFTGLVLIPNLTNFSSLIYNTFFLISYNLIIYFFIGFRSFQKLKKLFLFFNLIIIIFLSTIILFKKNYLDYFTSTKNNNSRISTIEYESPSFYGNIKVIKVKNSKNKIKSKYILFQDGLMQNTTDDSGNSLNEYIWIIHFLTKLSKKTDNALVLGFGAGIIPGKLSNQGFDVDTVDINPNLLNIAKTYFNYKSVNTKFFVSDARTYVRKCKKKYDVIVIDLFMADGVPEHLTTKEFYQDLKNCLNNDGIVISNTFMDFTNKLGFNSVLSTFNTVFKDVYYSNKVKNRVDNLFIVASRKGVIKNLDLSINFNSTPKHITPKIISILKSFEKFKDKEFNDQNIFFDEKNDYSIVFAKSFLHFRKKLFSITPSRFLIN